MRYIQFYSIYNYAFLILFSELLSLDSDVDSEDEEEKEQMKKTAAEIDESNKTAFYFMNNKFPKNEIVLKSENKGMYNVRLFI